MEYLNFINGQANIFVKWLLQDIVHILGTIVIIDIILGFTKGWVTKTFSSSQARRGVVSHTFALIIATIAHTFGELNNMTFFDTAIWLLVISYLGSIVENLAILGVPIPNIVTDKLSQVKDFFEDNVKNEIKTESQKVIDNKVTENEEKMNDIRK